MSDYFPEVNVDYGGLRWTVSYPSVRQVRVRAKHPVITGDAFDRSYEMSPNDFTNEGRADRGAALIREAARSLGIKEK